MTDPAVLAELLFPPPNGPITPEQIQAARDLDACYEALRWLDAPRDWSDVPRDWRDWVRRAAADNPATPPAELARAFGDADGTVRRAPLVAGGQGRSAEDVRASGTPGAVLLVFLALILFAAYCSR